MKQVLKHCDGPCNTHKYIWKNHNGKRYCQSCWNSIMPKKEISAKSEKQKKLDKEYLLLRSNYLLLHPYCEVHFVGCYLQASDIHHKYFGANRHNYFLDTNTWIAVCRYCHDKIHNTSSETLKELNLKL